jgi:DNA-binding transcriptional LysR family regulator
MEWQQLLGFYQVARLGSFTRAADATFRTQSALSQQVKALEEELGCRLFERIGRRKLYLTPAGEKLRRFAETLLAGYEVLKEEIDEIKGLPKGRLRLAAPFTTLYHLLPRRLKTYLGQFPQVELTLLDRPQRSVIALVKSGEVDFGLALESAVPKDLFSRRWQEVRTVLLAPLGHPLTRLPRFTLRQIAGYPLILPPRAHRGRIRLEEQFRKLGLSYQVIMESSNVELSSLYVEMGLGLSFATLARNLPGLDQRQLAFLPLDRYFKPDWLAVVLRRDKVLSPFKSAFLEILFGEAFPPDAEADSS